MIGLFCVLRGFTVLRMSSVTHKITMIGSRGKCNGVFTPPEIPVDPDAGKAWDTLLPVADQFPHVQAITYDLACYACQLGRLVEAQDWLARAFAGRDSERWKLMALEDPDLEPLWKEIPGG